jgi:hypothetical protein
MSIDLTIAASIRGKLESSGEGGTAALDISERLTQVLTNGTGANQANAVYIDEFSIAASGTLNIDLSGSLVDRLGNALVFTAVKAILLIADAANTNNVIYGNGTNPFVGPFSAGTATITAKPGTVQLLTDFSAAGWPVFAGSADVIKLENSAGSTAVTGTIVIVGEA